MTNKVSGDIKLPSILRNEMFSVSPDMSRKNIIYTKKEYDANQERLVKQNSVVERVYYSNKTKLAPLNNLNRKRNHNLELIEDFNSPRIITKNVFKSFDFLGPSSNLNKINAYEGIRKKA